MEKKNISLTSLEESLKKRILILDGAMGTMLQKLGLTEKDYRSELFAKHPQNLKGNNDILSLTLPDALEKIHMQYMEAGADIIETCSFGANRLSQGEYGTSEYCFEMARQSALIARRAADKMALITPDKPRWVAGSVGPTSKTLSMSPDVNDAGFRSVTFDQMAEAYFEQVQGLMAGGVDLLLVETIFDALNAKAALYAIDKCFAELKRSVPIMISATIADKSGRTLCGQTVEAFWTSIMHARPLIVGINCALGAEEMREHIDKLSSIATCFVSCYPNAGLPNALGGYDETPSMMAKAVRALAEDKLVNIVGGCCGTTPQYIQAIAQEVEDVSPRVPAKANGQFRLSGLEPYVISADTGFTMIGERTNLSGSAKFAKLIRSGDFENALIVARQQVENGANIIDINLDDPLLDSAKEMTTFLRLMAAEPDIAKVPVMLDSSKWDVLTQGLKCLQGRSLVNSISLKEGEEEFKRRALEIRRLGAAIVVMAFDEKGQGDSFDRKVAICTRAYNILVSELGFEPEGIVFDPAVLTVATGIEEHAGYGLDFINAVRVIKETLPGVRVVGGISNVSFALRGNNPVREAMHSVFLYHAIKAGLDMGIVNAGMLVVYEDIPEELRRTVEDVLLNSDHDATEHLLSIAEKYRGTGKAQEHSQVQWRTLTAYERLIHGVAHGIADYVEEDVKEALQNTDNPINIIDQPLMDGMKKVGKLFGAGKMFLPQVVKSARVMKKAVSVLEPFVEKKADNATNGTILMATVKGDVHDIGKNIVSVVLGCNGYNVVDAGVMVPCNAIIEKAKEVKAKAIGLSALITPSLDEIVTVAKQMEAEGLKIPLLVGGAATSKTHTAVKIAPVYSGTVVYVPDASKVTSVLADIFDADKGPKTAQEIKEEYDSIRIRHQEKIAQADLLTFEQAKQNAPLFTWQQDEIARPDFEGVHRLRRVDLKELVPYISWTPFFTAMGVKGAYPQILSDPNTGDEANKLFKTAQDLLNNIVEKGLLEAWGLYGFFPANSKKEDIILYANADRKRTLAVIPTLRQQGALEQNLALADFVAPLGSGCIDWVGVFALTCGIGLDKLTSDLKANNDPAGAIMAQLLADRLCEAFSEWLHKMVRSEWSYGRRENLSADDLKKNAYQGIRPAPGYPALPDHSLKFILWELMEPNRHIGMELTESGAMKPGSSVSGFYLSHPKSKYFTVGKITKDQTADYAIRRGFSLSDTERWLAPYLAYETDNKEG